MKSLTYPFDRVLSISANQIHEELGYEVLISVGLRDVMDDVGQLLAFGVDDVQG